MGGLRLAASVLVAFALVACGGGEPLPERDPSQVVRVPAIKGKHVQEAVSLLKARGLKAEVTEQRFPGLRPGTVVDQDPAANTEVQKGSLVAVEVVSERNR